VINAASNTVVATIGVGNHPAGVAFSPDGTRAYVTNNYSNLVTMIDTGANRAIGTFTTHQFGPSGIVVLPNGNIYVANEYMNNVTVHGPSGNLITTITGFAFPDWLARNSSGTRVYASNGNNGTVSVIDTSSNRVVANPGGGLNPTTVELSTDGSMLLVANENASMLTVISAASNSLITTVQRVGPMPFAIAMKP
jgi:YVTN family beta-propeller protein